MANYSKVSVKTYSMNFVLALSDSGLFKQS